MKIYSFLLFQNVPSNVNIYDQIPFYGLLEEDDRLLQNKPTMTIAIHLQSSYDVKFTAKNYYFVSLNTTVSDTSNSFGRTPNCWFSAAHQTADFRPHTKLLIFSRTPNCWYLRHYLTHHFWYFRVQTFSDTHHFWYFRFQTFSDTHHFWYFIVQTFSDTPFLILHRPDIFWHTPFLILQSPDIFWHTPFLILQSSDIFWHTPLLQHSKATPA